MENFSVLLCTILLYFLSRDVEGHGRLVEPPSRASAWRYGFNTPVNYDDNQLFCGGKSVQWDRNGGRCGVCGDPYSGPRDHEAGGRYATGTIVRSYRTGQTIDVTVELTANHKGWFEFRLCPNNNAQRRVTQSCLDRHVLPLADGTGTRLPISSDMRHVSTRLRLPRGLSCSQCVIQWKYNTGNSWGVDSKTGRGCVGCGPQEQFYGCSDVSITPNGRKINNHQPELIQPRQKPIQPRPQQYQPRRQPSPKIRHTHQWNGRWLETRGNPQPMPQNRPIQPWNDARLRGGSGPRDRVRLTNGLWSRERDNTERTFARCMAIGQWSEQSAMTEWCQNNCNLGNCPPSHCKCD